MKSALVGIDDNTFRRPALLVLLLFAVAFLAWHTILEFEHGVQVLASIQLALWLHFAFVLHRVWRRPYSIRLALAFLIPLLAVILIAMAHPDTPPNVFIWVFLMPVLSYSLLGRRPGFVVSLAGTLLALVAYLYKYAAVPEQIHVLALSDSLICLLAIWVAMDLYERNRERTTDALRQMATTDALTGLQNRRQLPAVFAHLAATADRKTHALAVVVIDLDHFKQINDRWGHHAGDAVLVHTAELLRHGLRESDWAFRLGGEEFCLLLPIARRADGAAVAEALRARIAGHPCLIEGAPIALSASIGVSIYPDDARSFERLLSLADARMYCAKQRGRNRVVSDDGDRQDAAPCAAAISRSAA